MRTRKSLPSLWKIPPQPKFQSRSSCPGWVPASSTPTFSPGVDLQYDTAGFNIKESIIVRAPQSSYTYHFRLSLNGLTPAEQEDGSILLKNAEGVSIYEIPAPNMVDATGAFSQDVTYTISGSFRRISSDCHCRQLTGSMHPIACYRLRLILHL